MEKMRLAQYGVKSPIPRILMLSILLIAAVEAPLRADGTMSYPDRKAIIVNNCPYIKLSNFWFDNRYEMTSYRFVQGMMWTNVSGQSIIAFDIVILRYDAFNDRINGVRWTITGNDSQNWMPLAPGYTGSDMTIGLTTEEVFTGIAYVRAARLKDGTIWRADTKKLLEQIRELVTDIPAFGDLNGEIKIKANP